MITPEQLIYLAVGVLAVLWLHKTFASSKATPAAPTITARVIDPQPVTPDTVHLLGLLHQTIEAKGIALAFDRKAAELVEERAKAVHLPWVAPSVAAPSEPPKA